MHRETGEFTTYGLLHVNGEEVVMVAAKARDRAHAIDLAQQLDEACDVFLNKMQEIQQTFGEGDVVVTHGREEAPPGQTLKPFRASIMSPGGKE